MKHVLLFAFVFIVHIYQSSSQEIRLDSLWTKFGGVGAMSFSPDSKTLLIAELQKLAGGSGTIRFYDAATGIEKDSIPETEYYDVRYTPDGKRIVQAGFGGEIKLYKAETYKLERTINAPQNAGYIDFSPETNLVVSAGSASITIFDIEAGIVKAVLSRPYKYATGPNTTDYYWNGKVSFSADGKYIIGKYENSLVRWDWQNAPTKPEMIIPNFGNRAIIGFSPDKKYLVQQSNYLWDIQQKKQIAIEGLTGYESETANGFASTSSGSCIAVINEDHSPKLINLSAYRVFSTLPFKYSTNMLAISPDSLYFARGLGSNEIVLVERMQWNTSSVEGEHVRRDPILTLHPQPAQSGIEVSVENSEIIENGKLTIIDVKGMPVNVVFSGTLLAGIHAFPIKTTSFSSGYYRLLLTYKNKQITTSFIINH